MKIKTKLIPIGIFSLAALAIFLPLLKPGFILTLDMVFTPNLRMPVDVSNDYLLKALLHGLDVIMPADIVQKLMLFVTFLAAGCGMYRLVRLRSSQWLSIGEVSPGNLGAYFAGLLYMANPFTYDRLMTGQYAVLIGYALLPWLARSLYMYMQEPRWRRAAAVTGWMLAISIASIHTIGMAAILVALMLARYLWSYRHLADRPKAKRLVLMSAAIAATWLLASSYWLVPLVSGDSPQARIVNGLTASDNQVFATTGDSNGERIGNVLGLQGFWAERYGLFQLPQQALPVVWYLIVVALIALVVLGAVSLWRRNRGDAAIFITVAVLAVLLASGVGLGWLMERVPLLSGYREPQKFVALLVLSYGVLGAAGAAAILRALRRQTWPTAATVTSSVAGAIIILPLVLAPTLWWGANNQLRATQYPKNWQQVNQTLKQDQSGDFKTLVLPWHMYMYLSFAGRTVANPAGSYFDKPVLTSDDAEFEGVALNPNKPLAREADIAVGKALGTIEGGAGQFGKDMAALNVKYVIFIKDSDYRKYGFLAQQPDLKVVADYPEITLYQVVPK